MKKTILLILAIACFSNIAFTQSQKAYKKKADEALAAKNYSAAFAQYHFLVNNAGRNSLENNFGAAESARNAKVYYLAETYYLKVAAHEDGLKAHPLTEFWLADVQKRQGRYQEAKDRFRSFLDNGGSANAVYAERARKEIEDCKFAIKLEPLFEEDKIEHMDTSVNSVVLDFAPVKSGGLLYYSSMRDGYKYTQKTEGGSPWVQQVDDWRDGDSKAGLTQIFTKDEESGKLELFDQFNEGDRHTAHVAFAKNNTRVYYTLCENLNAADINCKIYYRNLEGENKWGNKVDAGINLNNYTTTQPSVGTMGDKEVLFFASDRDGTKGGLDIWCSFIEDDACSTPVNLSDEFGGNQLNTEADDISPFWDSKSQTLYFSSEGHVNMGSHDIYKVKLEKGSCGTIEHLGAPINSSYDDTYYTLSDDRKSAYFTSNRPGGLCGSYSDDSLCICYDIYKMATPKVKLEVNTYNAITKLPIWSTNVNLANQTNSEEDSQEKDDNHFYEWYDSPLGFDFDFGVLGSKPQYEEDMASFSTKFETRVDTVISVDLFLMPKMDLTTYVFDKASGERLPGATVQLHYIGTQSSIVNTQSDAAKSEYFDKLTHDKIYMVTGSKPGYSSDTTYVTIENGNLSTVGLSEPTSLKAELRLCKDLLPDIIPLYFYNAIPKGKSSDVTCRESYEETYRNYLPYRDEFIRKSGSPEVMQDFFDNKVIAGFNRLERFAEELYDYLDKERASGKKATVFIKAYASRRAADIPTYSNEALTGRRASSLINYLKSWTNKDAYGNAGNKNLIEFFNANRIEIVTEKFGHTQSCSGPGCKGVEDIKASEDRRVEILRVEYDNVCEPEIKIKPTYTPPVKKY